MKHYAKIILLKYVYAVVFLSSILLICSGQSQIPLRMIKEQSKIKTPQEFMRLMTKPQIPARPGASTHPGGASGPSGNREIMGMTNMSDTGSDGTFNQITQADVCEPRPMSVPIPQDNDPRVMYWPMCTRLDQCGGCCGHDLLECAPTRTENVKVQVMKQRLNEQDNDRYEYIGNTEVTLQRHLSCECRCKIKPEHCDTNIQQYDQINCVCKCRNAHQAHSCTLPKKWDEKHCRCVCPKLVNCLDGEYFDFSTCSCTQASAAMLQQVTHGTSHSHVNDPCSHTRCISGRVAQVVNGKCRCVSGRATFN